MIDVAHSRGEEGWEEQTEQSDLIIFVCRSITLIWPTEGLVSNGTLASAKCSRFIVLAGTLKINIATQASSIVRLKNMPF